MEAEFAESCVESPGARQKAKSRSTLRVGSRRKKSHPSSLEFHRDVDFTNDEMRQRASLFKVEFNQEELHDRILVVEVMPDGYEILELEARLEACGFEKDNDSEKPQDVSSDDELCDESDEKISSVEELEESCTERRSGVISSGLYSHYFVEAKDCKLSVGSCEDICTSERESGSDSDVVDKVFESEIHGRSLSESSHVASHSQFLNRFPERENDFSTAELDDQASFAPEDICESEKLAASLCWEDKSGQDKLEGNETGSCSIEASCLQATGSVHVKAEESSVCALREHRLYVHACFLAVNSRYFRSLLYRSGMKECSSSEVHMKVADTEEAGFLLLIESVYNPDVLDDADVNSLLNVLRLSVKYDLKFSTLKARRVLQAIPLTLSVCEIILEAMGREGLTDLDDVMDNVEELLYREFEPLDETWESDKFASLSKTALQILLGSDKLVVQSENTVFVALMRWIAKHAEVYGNLSECSDLLSLVRFGLIKPTYLNDVIRVHELATKLNNFDAVYLAAITHHALPTKRRPRSPRRRHWCEPKTPTFVWILDTDQEMFVFDDEKPTNSRSSSSFWYFGYKMHLTLNLSAKESATRLVLVVENLSDDGSVELTYDVDVKFMAGLHKSYTCEPFVYRRNRPSRGMYPFADKCTVEEIKELLLGGSVAVTIMFEVSLEKLRDDSTYQPVV